MKTFIQISLIYILVMISVVNGVAQLSGPSTVTIGQTIRYTYLAGGVLILPTWQITKGVKVTAVQTGLYYTVDVNWNAVGAGSVAIYDGKNVKATINVNVLPAPPTVNSASRCGPGTLSLSAVTGNGGTTVRWYLAASGGSYFFQGNNWTTPTLSTTATYYVTTYSSAGESTPRIPIVATINSVVTAVPAVSGNGRFGTGALSLNATGASSGSTYGWYNNSGQMVSTGSSYSTPVLTSSITGYMSVRIQSSVGCAGPPTAVNILIEPIPVIKSSGNRLVLGNPVSLESGLDYTTYSWKNAAGSILSASKNFTASDAGIYTLTVTKPIVGTGVSVPFRVYDQLENVPYNFIAENLIQTESVQDTALLSKLSVLNNQQIIDYYDGLGRKVQRVATRHSPQQNDLVNVNRYDDFGRETRAYLPFTSAQNGLYKENIIDSLTGSYIGAAAAFYQNQAADAVTDDPRPFKENIFDGHPSGRSIGHAGPGQNWFAAGKKISRTSEPNSHGAQTSQEQIIVWKLNDGETLPVRNRTTAGNLSEGFYPSGSLLVESTKNERGYETRNYFDKLGRLVLRKVQVKETITNLNDSLQWAQTYFVYDDFNRLRFVLQPELVKSLVRTNVDPSPVQLSNLAFIYRYDERGREIVKKMPGADSVFQVYDLRNRLVMRQNGTQRNLNQWEFLKYDALNRIIISGIYTHTGSLSQAAMSALISRTEFFESYSGSSTNHGYTNVVFPMDRTDILQVRYYDDYRFRSLWPASFGYLNDALTSAMNGATYTQAVSSLVYQRGNVTGIKSRVVGGSDFIKTVYYYDQNNNVSQSIQDVFVNGINAGTERNSSLYDFTGRLLRSRITHRAGLPEQRLVNKRFEYDHAGRLINSWLQLDGRLEILIRQNKWNELDQLTDVKLHSTDNGISFKQSIDYRYNIRGWISSVNNASLIADGVTNDDANDLFGLNILYESADVSLNNTPDFSGNVSTIRWSINQGKSVEKERAYRFNYDPMDRLKTSEMFSNKSGWLLTSANREDGMAYDLNGNLVTLRRTDENGMTQDQLRYLYGSGANYGNKLLSVQDSGDPLSGFLDVQTSMDYTYNAVGNLKIDRNSKISGIEYNYLDLPAVLTDENGLRQKNFYDAGGRKVRSEYYGSSGQLLKATDFTGALIYEQGTLNRYEHEDGRILYNNYRYQYFLKDHQNNVRLTFDADPETKTAIATFELSAATLEQTQFLRINSVKRIYSTLLDRTNGASPGYSIRLSGASNERYGPAKSIQVFPGDEFRAEVFAKYLDKNQSSWSASLTTLVAQIISGTAGVVQEGSSFSTSTSSFPFAGLLSSGTTDAAPMAYLNWLVFDKNYKFIPSVSGYVRLSTTAREYGQDVAFEKLISPLIKITEPGYVYIYLSNEESQPVEVYFDDFTVSHFRSPVVQMNDYLPMGNTFNTFERDDVQEQILKFNSKPVDNFFSFKLADFGRRNYALTAGRFFLQDRFQEKYFGLSPYQHAANNPLKFSDHQGDSIIQVTIRDQSGYIKGNNVLFIDHTLFGDLKGLLNDAIETQTYIHLNSSFRTVARQRQLYQDLRAISPAEAGRSAHNAGLAIDFNVFVNNDPTQGLDPGNTSLNSDHGFITRAKEQQWRFGGDFKSPDNIHLDKRESVGNFSELVGRNQRQVDGYRMLRVPEERIKRKEIIELNK